MRQQVNLYNNFPKPPKYDITLQQALIITLGFSGFLLMVLIFKILTVFWYQYKTNSLQREQAAIIKSIEDIKREHPELLTINQLQAENAALNNDLKNKMQLLNQLDQLKTNKDYQGYAAYMTAIAESIVPDVWIKNIKIAGEGNIFTIEGAALNSRQIMQFLQNLSNSNIFRSKKFKVVTLQSKAETAQEINFQISTEAMEKPK